MYEEELYLGIKRQYKLKEKKKQIQRDSNQHQINLPLSKTIISAQTFSVVWFANSRIVFGGEDSSDRSGFIEVM